MTKLYLSVYLCLMLALATGLGYAHADGKKPRKTDTTKLVKVFTNKTDKSYLKNGIRMPMPALRPSVTIYGGSHPSASHYEPDKVLTNVTVSPNPITDQINLRYYVSKNATVNIKIMDILGNEVITLFSQRVDQGEQKFTFNLNNKLSSGFYFVRMVAGNESPVMKRIAIL